MNITNEIKVILSSPADQRTAEKLQTESSFFPNYPFLSQHFFNQWKIRQKEKQPSPLWFPWTFLCKRLQICCNFVCSLCQACYGLQHLQSFSEYPLHMQEKLCKVAWYQEWVTEKGMLKVSEMTRPFGRTNSDFEFQSSSKEGYHTARSFCWKLLLHFVWPRWSYSSNKIYKAPLWQWSDANTLNKSFWYLHLAAVVRVWETNPQSGETEPRTVAILRKGTSFGVSRFIFKIPLVCSWCFASPKLKRRGL